MRRQNGIINTVIGIGPYFGFLFALIGAPLIGLRSSTDERTLAVGVAVASKRLSKSIE